ARISHGIGATRVQRLLLERDGRAHPPVGRGQRPRPRMDAEPRGRVILGVPMAVTATRLLDNYVAGRWTPAAAATGELDVTNPATGSVLARVPLSGAADLDAAVQ